MIDTHCHLLPGVDDGARDLSESLQMARDAWERGVRLVVCTPHLRSSAIDPVVSAAEAALTSLDRELRRQGVDLLLDLGYELDFSLAASLEAEELRRFALGTGGKYLLLEAPTRFPSFCKDLVFRLRLAGFTPIIAHPERSSSVQKDPGFLDELIHMGVHLQGTTSSLRHFGVATRKTLLRMIRSGRCSLLATDAHYWRKDSWSFEAALDELDREVPGWDWEPLLFDNPARVVRGLVPLLPAESAAKEGWRGMVRRKVFR